MLAGRNFPCLTNLADINEYPYPILPPEELVKPQPWKEVKGLGWKKDKTRQYFCEIDRFDDLYKRKSLEPRKFIRNKRWDY